MLIPACNPSPWTGPTGNNTYLLTGAVPTLIDAGVGEAEHLAAVGRGLMGQPLAQVLVTHGHPDHLSGVPAIRARWPGVTVRKIAPGEGTDIAAIEDGEAIRAGDGILHAVGTPGHAPDHCCFLDDASREIYCGDLLRAGGTIVIAASRGGDLREYLASLRRVRALEPLRLLPGHGPAIEDPSGAIEAYLLHRAGRDAQVLHALADGLDTPSAIAARIYRGLDPALEPAATDTVLAHLIKLESEGRASRRDERWTVEA